MIIAADEDTFDACKSYDWLFSVQTSEEARRALLQIPLLLRSLLWDQHKQNTHGTEI